MALGSGRLKWAWVCAGLAALGGLGVAGAGLLPLAGPTSPLARTEGAAPLRPAQPVRVTELRFDRAADETHHTGIIRPGHEAGLGFRLPGKIVERRAEVGDKVTRGQVLARLDDTDARLERDLAAAEQAAAQVDRSRAEAELTRTRRLFSAGHVSQAALDRAASGAAEAASRADRAQRALRLAQNRLSYTQLVAEADGVVTATPGEAGQVVAAGQVVLSLARAGSVDVVFALPEQDRAAVATLQARAELWDSDGKRYTLTLRDIAPDVDPAGRTYRVRMTIDQPDAEATLGRTVTVTLARGPSRPAAAVPLAAVMSDGSGPSVWRLTGDRVERVAVELASVTGSAALIRGALRDGDRIVSLGTHKIDPTRPVRVVETRATPES